MPLDDTGAVAATESHDREVRLRFLRLDTAAADRLRALTAAVEAALPSIADKFYKFFGQSPKLAALLGGTQRVTRLRATQAAHWMRLFTGTCDDAYFANATKIGAVHARIGLEPRWYLAGYCLTLESLAELLVQRHRAKPALAADIAAVLRAAFLDMDLALASYLKNDGAERAVREMNALAEVLERELQLAVGEISIQTERLAERAEGLSRIAADMRQTTQEVQDGIGTTAATVGTVASASQQLEAASREITGRIDRAAAVSQQTVAAATAAGEIMGELTGSVDQINGVVRLVQSIAKQTRMLSLNATIEAARAGEAGRGSAVVASEVKELARQTEEAIATVSGRAHDIRLATGGAAESVAGIGEQITSVSDIAADVANSASQQREATAEIARSVELAAGHTAAVAERTGALAQRAVETEQTAALFRDLAGRVSIGVTELAARLSLILRTSEGGSRRAEPREPMCVAFRFKADGYEASGWTGDLSPHGALLVHEAPDRLAGADAEIDLEGIGHFRARVAAASPMGIHAMFRDVGVAESAAIAVRIAQEQTYGLRYITIAQDTAGAIARAFEAALAQHRIGRAELFDSIYRPIDDTDPPQVLTGATSLCDELLPSIIEPVKALDETIVFCAACDRNGYIATHNRIYSEKQRPGDRTWNMAHSRNRRIFDDRAGLMAASNGKPILVQAYARDMGGGARVLLKEFDAPIAVAGARWGALRLAVKMPN